jgi:hypothetical protein
MTLGELDPTSRHAWRCIPALELRRQAAFGQLVGKLLLQRSTQESRAVDCHSLENHTFDMYVDLHATATAGSCQRKSSSLMGRSFLRNSVRAASRIRGIVNGEFARAARKAELSAML